ncbi:MAG: hypothetical protein H6747_00620 [Deltaproteobacteria bacterium]|nr:hypothetical protein [Deltaproteobacteria bacterium]
MKPCATLLLALVIGLMSTACGTDEPQGKTDAGNPFGSVDSTNDISVGGGDSGGGVDGAGGTSDGASGTQDTGKPKDIPCEYEGAWGCACEKASDCDSTFCVQSAEGKICTKTCLEDCPSGFQCLQAGANDTTFICLPKYASLCQPCAEHADCGTQGAQGGESKCIPFDLGDGTIDGSFCGAPCSESNACPDGFSCKPFGLPGEVTVSPMRAGRDAVHVQQSGGRQRALDQLQAGE